MGYCEYEHIKAIHEVESEEHKNRSQIEHPTENIYKEFINLTENAYCGEVIKELKESYKNEKSDDI